MYFWPLMIFEEFAKTADQKEKEKIKDIVEKLQIKADRFNSKSNKELYRFFSSQFTSLKPQSLKPQKPK